MSYMILRRVVGMIGLGLPVVLVTGHLLLDHDPLPPSISDYYYSDMRDLLIGCMWALAVFMASYRGHDRRDDITGDITCVSAILVSLFPVAPATGATWRVPCTSSPPASSSCRWHFSAWCSSAREVPNARTAKS